MTNILRLVSCLLPHLTPSTIAPILRPTEIAIDNAASSSCTVVETPPFGARLATQARTLFLQVFSDRVAVLNDVHASQQYVYLISILFGKTRNCVDTDHPAHSSISEGSFGMWRYKRLVDEFG